ncbi:1,4-dihydroxy-2-naphthoate octaprenyltransferase [Bifidobacterium sp. ESL0763]|uniref:1,4-dihydroxy-2-naphthoate octaprenyltransferase n=1 Tax=Bifidobacterium sp. ESL0763 TaxID=2983227 RepID=UPI0023F6645F|nr:1,4-dihydroxy-2-naphthoate octaprenyltransferase [Bifidobacterium sp. ESL0763]MDF7663505.1 1,4-dihydroxy-2-naphthoate octaprenyltransferase [Bifidobacterium sp. ESL0763]
MMNGKMWVAGARPKTLLLSIGPALVGIAAGYGAVRRSGPCGGGARACVASGAGAGASSWGMFALLAALCLVVAVALQIAANFANDYSDGLRGTDDNQADLESQEDMPLHLLANGLTTPRDLLIQAGLAALVACLAGLATAIITGYWLYIPLGVVCLLAGWFYVGGKHPYGYVGFGEVSVFLFFGLVAVLGTQFALAGRVDAAGIAGAVLSGLFTTSMMLVNNLRDMRSDRTSGKMTLVVHIGSGKARDLLFGTYLMPLALTGLMALLPLALAFRHGSAAYVALAVVDLAIGALCVVVARRVAGCVGARNYHAALPMVSVTSLLFSLVFVVTQLALAL